MHYTGMELYTTYFTDGSLVTCRGTCASDAGGRALRIRDHQRGDRLAVVERIVLYYGI
ncbi:MAG TPA: hypothetical protein VLA89_02880 [Gemmatimonadales bacterium]|nr:hypothetical protein [Gemmatimonadales bacterium]